MLPWTPATGTCPPLTPRSRPQFFLENWKLNLLMCALPFAVAARYSGWSDGLTFALSCLALVPLAEVRAGKANLDNLDNIKECKVIRGREPLRAAKANGETLCTGPGVTCRDGPAFGARATGWAPPAAECTLLAPGRLRQRANDSPAPLAALLRGSAKAVRCALASMPPRS
jgi:hypothetical protein